MAATPKLVHLVLMTRRLAEMRAWYCTILGAHIVYENPSLSFLTFDEEHHRLALVSPPDAPLIERTPLTTGMHHSAYSFNALPELMEKYTALKALGIEPLTPIQHGVTTSLYYRDPDGNLVEFQIDNFKTPAEATAYMHGPEFAQDPIGPAFDPQRMAEALREGIPIAELTTRAWALAGPKLPDPMARMMSPPGT